MESCITGPPVARREMGPLAQREYDFIRRLVYERSRINLGPDKIDLVVGRLRRRLRALRLDNYEAYCAYLRSPAGGEELPELLDAISTNVTNFFRERAHFDHLAERVLPEWESMVSRRAGGTFRVWSAACSSGEEPYSIAIVLAEFFRSRPGQEWRVEASDISTRMLHQAECGIYPAEQVKLPDSEWLGRYFQKGIHTCNGCYRVRKALRNRVILHRLNLFAAQYPFAPGLDVIFCRNVMIYFDRETQEELVAQLRDQLRPGGYLVVGHAESLIGIRHQLQTVQSGIYRRA